MYIRTNRKAAAFRRGGFLLFIVGLLWGYPSEGQSDEKPVSYMTDAHRELVVREFVLANVEFTLLHEIGHALIHQFPVPVLGREEDAADQMATTWMIIRHDIDVDTEAINRLLMVSTEWMNEWDEEASNPRNEHAYWDSHSLAIQRFYNVNCLLYGANPDELSFLFDTEVLPAERGFDCEQAFQQAVHANFWLLDAFGRDKDTLVPFNGLTVEYEETRNPRHEKLRTWVVESGLVQDINSRATELFPWPNPIRLFFDNCPGSSDAYYNRNVSEIVICYELLDVFMERTERSLNQTVELVCRNPGLRRLYKDQLGCL